MTEARSRLNTSAGHEQFDITGTLSVERLRRSYDPVSSVVAQLSGFLEATNRHHVEQRKDKVSNERRLYVNHFKWYSCPCLT